MVVYNINLHPIPSYDTIPARLLPWNIYENKNLYLDTFAQSQGLGLQSFALQGQGHYLSEYPIVTPLLVVPLLLIPYGILKLADIPVSVDDPTFVVISLIFEKLLASCIASLSVIFLYLILRRLFSERTSLVCSLVYAFATCTWVISSQALWQHGTAELLLCIMLLIILLIIEKNTPWLYLILGCLGALYVFNRPPDVFLLVPVLVFVILGKEIGLVLRYLIACVLTAAPLLFYNIFYFGSWFGGYHVLFGNISLSFLNLTVLAALLVSPNRGLFFYSPVLIFSLVGVYVLVKDKIPRNPVFRRILLLYVIFIPMTWIFYSFFSMWWGGESFGYRFLVDSLPVFTIFLGCAIEYLWGASSSAHPVLRVFFIVAVIVSVLVQVCGAFYYYYDWDMKNQEHASINDQPSRVWDLSDLQIFYGIRLNPNPYGILLEKVKEQRGSSFHVNAGS